MPMTKFCVMLFNLSRTPILCWKRKIKYHFYQPFVVWVFEQKLKSIKIEWGRHASIIICIWYYVMYTHIYIYSFILLVNVYTLSLSLTNVLKPVKSTGVILKHWLPVNESLVKAGTRQVTVGTHYTRDGFCSLIWR